MRTVRQSGEYELEVSKSRFLCALARVSSEEEARAVIRQRRKLHHTARHHCSAYVLGDGAELQKSSDDGEPAGTAGVPMLEVLRRKEITNTIAVISRYFGGVLLGSGGLIRAYSGAVSQALDHVGMVERRPVRTVSATVDFARSGKLEADLRTAGYHIAGTHYAEKVRFDLHVSDAAVENLQAWLAEATSGAVSSQVGELTYAEIDI